MPFIFKVTDPTPSKLKLEAATPSTPYSDTVYTHVNSDLSEALSLELELHPLQDGEEISFTQNAHIRVVNLAPAPCPTPTPKRMVL
jgi:hypothetical protein